MAAGGGVGRPDPTGYGHLDFSEFDQLDYGPRRFRLHVNVDEYEPKNWGEAWDERHREPRREIRPANEVDKLWHDPQWPIRTEAMMSEWTWKRAFGDPRNQIAMSDLKDDGNGVFSHNNRVVAVAFGGNLYVAGPAPAYAEAVSALSMSKKLPIKKVEQSQLMAAADKQRTQPKEEPAMTPDEGNTPMFTPARAAAKKDGVSAAHKKIISDILSGEDAKPTGDAVRLGYDEEGARHDFARYQIPTDRGLKDIEIWNDRVHVRSHSTYFAKQAEDGMDGLPDRMAPDDDIVPNMPPAVENGEEEIEEGTCIVLHMDMRMPEGMADEDGLSMMDEVMGDPGIADMINKRLKESGIVVSVGDVGFPDEDEDDEDVDDDGASMPADAVVEPDGNDVQEGSGCCG